jgi:hypothetical protein
MSLYISFPGSARKASSIDVSRLHGGKLTMGISNAAALPRLSALARNRSKPRCDEDQPKTVILFIAVVFTLGAEIQMKILH